MEEPQYELMVEIPPIFCSQGGNVPFKECIECNRDLKSYPNGYYIEKAFRSYTQFGLSDTVFEYAICAECLESLISQFSTESKSRLECYFTKNADFSGRLRLLDEIIEGKARFNFDEWLGSCFIKGTPVIELEEYQIAGWFRGESMIVSVLPYLIGGPAMEEVVALLSQPTLDLLDDFSGRHFGLPPELKNAPRPRFVPLI